MFRDVWGIILLKQERLFVFVVFQNIADVPV
jgi:hypothetical protein